MSQLPDEQNKHDEKAGQEASGRRNFLKLGFLTAGLTIAGGGIQKVLSDQEEPASKETGEKVKLLTPEGKLVEVDSAYLKEQGIK